MDKAICKKTVIKETYRWNLAITMSKF